MNCYNFLQRELHVLPIVTPEEGSGGGKGENGG
jgi:hypothetical protein